MPGRIFPERLATALTGRGACSFGGFDNPHQAFGNRADALHSLPPHFIGEKIEPLVFIKEQQGIAAPVFRRVSPPEFNFFRLDGGDQAAHAGAKIRAGEHLARAGRLAASDTAENMHSRAGVAQREIIRCGELQQRRIEIA